MTRTARMAVFAVGILGLAALLVWGFTGLPEFGSFDGRYGDLISQIAVPQRRASEVVAAVTFDYRGFDTLGEEFILFAAAVGVLTLLRVQRREEELPADPAEGEPTARSAALGSLATMLVGPVLLLGLYVITHGHLTPGGGFAGGIILTSALVLVYLAGSHLDLGRTRPIEGMELSEGLGVVAFVLIGLGGMIFAAAYMENFLPLGRFTFPWSGGQIPLLNLAVALAVMGATLAILAEMLDYRLVEKGGRR